jgi:xylose isomerase
MICVGYQIDSDEHCFLDAGYSVDSAQQLRDINFDRQQLTSKKLPYERLDQLTVELLLGVR